MSRMVYSMSARLLDAECAEHEPFHKSSARKSCATHLRTFAKVSARIEPIDRRSAWKVSATPPSHERFAELSALRTSETDADESRTRPTPNVSCEISEKTQETGPENRPGQDPNKQTHAARPQRGPPQQHKQRRNAEGTTKAQARNTTNTHTRTRTSTHTNGRRHPQNTSPGNRRKPKNKEPKKPQQGKRMTK